MIEVFLYLFNCLSPYTRENKRVVVEDLPTHQIRP